MIEWHRQSNHWHVLEDIYLRLKIMAGLQPPRAGFQDCDGPSNMSSYSFKNGKIYHYWPLLLRVSCTGTRAR
jgi:hypothetical protein